MWAVQRKLLKGESGYFDALKDKYETVLNFCTGRVKIKKLKKSFCPRASTGNTHLGMRYAGSKLFSNANITSMW